MTLSHLDDKGKPSMVDVGGKAPTRREAAARAVVRLPAEVTALLRDGDLVGKKGPVFQTAIVAGTMAVKRTADLIPFCHPLAIESCKIDIAFSPTGQAGAGGEALVTCRVGCTHKTGVEMEALTGATVAALTIYDMCKSASHHIVIAEIKLLEKSGGKSDFRDPSD